MSSMAAIRAAKEWFNDHCGDHKCRAGQCAERKRLWLEYMATADRWCNEEEQCLTPTISVSSSGTEFV